MLSKIYTPQPSRLMNIVCFVSGSGTNYREIARRDPAQRYLVFTNRPGCGGTRLARANNHKVIEINHVPFLKDARQKYGPRSVPRNCVERENFEKEVCRQIEEYLDGQPDLVCLAGYDQWTSDWLVDRYYPRMLNVHPGDTTMGYDGLYWIPSAKAILNGDSDIRSTLFIVDKGEDTGPVLMQSSPLRIERVLLDFDKKEKTGLIQEYNDILSFARTGGIKTYTEFTARASEDRKNKMKHICESLQEALKVSGDWQIYPYAVHELIARGRVAVDGRDIFLDGKKLPGYGFRPG